MIALVALIAGITLLGLSMVARDVVLKVRASTVATLDQAKLVALEKQASSLEERVHALEYKQPLGGRR